MVEWLEMDVCSFDERDGMEVNRLVKCLIERDRLDE